MSSNPRSHPSPRARPVAEAPIDALLARVDELARRWAVALILERPLERIAELHLDMVAREAPALCAQVIRALESDAELERLALRDAGDGSGETPPARRLVLLAGAGGTGSAVEIVEAVEALRGVLWEATLDELRWPVSDRSLARQAVELADRLAFVCATVLAAAVAVADAGDAWAPAETAEAGTGAPGGGTGDPQPSPVGPRGAILIDEHEHADTEPARPGDSEPGPPEPERRQARPLPWDPSARQSRSVSAALVDSRSGPMDEPVKDAAPPPQEAQGTAAGARGAAGERPEIEVRDQRGQEGPAAWISSIARQLERFEQDRLPFAVLLVELGDAERLRRAALPGAISGLTGRIERTLAQELRRIGGHPAQRRGRPAGELTSERPGRYWLLAPETDAAAAKRLAEWVLHTIGPLAGPRWAPLEVMVGIAVCPDDGREAAALAVHADLGLYAPRASER